LAYIVIVSVALSYSRYINYTFKWTNSLDKTSSLAIRVAPATRTRGEGLSPEGESRDGTDVKSQPFSIRSSFVTRDNLKFLYMICVHVCVSAHVCVWVCVCIHF
jgi:hypothetical protein